MGYGFRVEVWGDYALFTRPETKVERVSYDVITPSAARGLIEAIYWKPAIRIHIDRVHVLKPIRFTNVRRNEVSEKLLASSALSALNGSAKPLYLNRAEAIQQRAAMVLQDVHYVIDAHFTMTDRAGPEDTPEKHYAIMLRRLQKGQCYHQPCFGAREFPARFRLFEGDAPAYEEPDMTRDLGLMLYDMDFSDVQNIQPMFFRAKVENAVMQVADCEVFR